MISQVQSPWNPRLLWFALPSLLGGSMWWYVVSQTLEGRLAFTTAGLSLLLTFIIYGFFSFALWLGSFVVGGYTIQSRLVRFTLAGAVTLPMWWFFPPTLITVAVFGLSWIVMWWGIERFVQDAHSRLHVKPHLSAGWALPVIVTLVMLGVSTLYYQQLRGSSDSPEELGRRLSDQTVTVIERFLPNFIGGYQPDYTLDRLVLEQLPPASQLLADIKFDELASSFDKEQALRERLEGIEGFEPSEITVDPNQTREQFEAELEVELERAREQIATNIRTALAEQFQVEIRDDQPVHDVIVTLVNKQYDRYVKEYVSIIPWLLSLGLFFILKILTGAFLFTTTWVGWLLLWLYRHLHIVHISHETVPAERVGWGK